MSCVPGRREQDTPALLGTALADRRPSGRWSTAARCTSEGGSPPPGTRQWAVGDAQQKTGLLSSVPPVPVTGLRLGGQAGRFRPAGWQAGFGSPARTVWFQVPATPPKDPRARGRERRGTRSGWSSLLPLPELSPCVGIREQRRSVSVGSRRRAHRTFGSDQFFASRSARPAGRLRATSGSPSGARCRVTGGTGGAPGVLREVLTRRAGRSRSGLDCPNRDPKGRRRASSEPDPAAQRGRILRDEVPPCGTDRQNVAFGLRDGDRTGTAKEKHARKGSATGTEEDPKAEPQER